MNTRKGDWFVTFIGQQFWPLDPRPEEINIRDIGHALSQTCRFGGHSHTFYSVAQHSVLVSQNLPDELKMVGLLHDATEAYLGDMVRPLKISMPEYKKVEGTLWLVIAERFGLPAEIPIEVKDADNRALLTERRDLLNPLVFAYRWSLDELGYRAFPEKIIPTAPYKAEAEFLCLFAELSHLGVEV